MLHNSHSSLHIDLQHRAHAWDGVCFLSAEAGWHAVMSGLCVPAKDCALDCMSRLFAHLCRARHAKFGTSLTLVFTYLACTYGAELMCVHVQAGVSSVLG